MLSGGYILSIDLGTSALKSILYDKEFHTVSSCTEETETIHSKPTWAEQDQAIWCRSAASAIKKTLGKAGAEPNEVKMIGICAQSHGPSLVDERGNPMMHCLIWPDLRAIPQAEEFSRGNYLWKISAHYTAAKLLWIKQNRPEIYDKAHRFLVPTDFLRTMLTGDLRTDPTSAQSTQMFDNDGQTWNWKMIDALGIHHNLFPTIYPTGDIAGSVTDSAAEEMGLSAGTPAITGGGDFSVTTPVLNRMKAKNSLMLYLGTAPIAGLIDDDGKWVSFGGMSASGGAALKWFKEQFCSVEEELAKKNDENPYALMDRKMSMIEPGSECLVFLPHMMGERSPYNDYARGVISGLSLGHTREHIMRALLEGITFQLRSYWENAQARNGYEAKRIIVFGGGAKSSFWRQLIADTFGYPSYRLKSNDLGALHLAALSSIALGYYKNLDDAYERIDLSVEGRLEPSAGTREKIEKAYRHFLKIEENAKATYTSDNFC